MLKFKDILGEHFPLFFKRQASFDLCLFIFAQNVIIFFFNKLLSFSMKSNGGRQNKEPTVPSVNFIFRLHAYMGCAASYDLTNHCNGVIAFIARGSKVATGTLKKNNLLSNFVY